MYKVQRIGTKTFVTVGTFGEANSMAHSDAKMNNTALIISENRNGRWYKVQAVSRDYEVIQRSRGFEVRKRNGKWWLYLERVYNGKYTWISDYTYSRLYSFATALDIFKKLTKEG